MSESIDLEKIEQKARGSIAKDGLTYIMMGFLILAVGISMQKNYLIFVPLLALVLIPVSEALRRRITYPRIGYVKFTTPENFGRGLIIFCAIACIFLLGVIFIAGGRFSTFAPLAIAFVFALAMFFGLSMQGMRLRDWLIILLIITAGLVTSFTVADWRQATAIILGLTGSLLMIIGVSDLVLFLRKYPPTQAAEFEEYHDDANAQ